MAIEDLLREAAAKGLTHLTLYPVDSNDGKSTYWNARATPSTAHSYIQVANFDPVKAVELVLEALPRAKRRTAPKIGNPKDFTAAVKDQAHRERIEKGETDTELALERDQADPAVDWTKA